MAPTEASGKRSESRVHPRFKMDYEGTLHWPGGKMKFRGIDMHDLGAGVRTWRRLKPGTLVLIHQTTFNRAGFAVVRHCTPRGLGFHIGLQFRCPLIRPNPGCWQFQHVDGAAESLDAWAKLAS